MGIGAGIFLIAVGAILTFAVNARFSGIELGTVGVILMVVGALGIVLELVLFAPRRRSVISQTRIGPQGTERVVRDDDVR